MGRLTDPLKETGRTLAPFLWGAIFGATLVGIIWLVA